MNISKLMLAGICVTVLLVSMVAASAITMNTYKAPQTASIPVQTGLIITISSSTWTNGSVIDWGPIMPGQTYTKPISFTNTGTTAITSILLSIDVANPLPTGWTETMSAFTITLYPSQTAGGGLITLVVPPTATAGTYSWNAYITAS